MRCTLGAIIAAIVLSVIDLAAVGRVGPLVIALDVIAATLLPFGILSFLLSLFEAPEDGGEGNDDGGGGGGSIPPPDDVRPCPTGGLAFDWDRFEADFRTYADRAPALR